MVHLISRVIHKQKLLAEEGMAELLRILRSQAAFAGIEVVTYCFLGNHFHVLVWVDGSDEALEAVDDDELARRFEALYGSRRSPSLGVDAETLRLLLAENGRRAEELRTRMKARMGNASVFMKEFKTRFSKWHNRRHQTVGTFWAERFLSITVERGSEGARRMAAYIDLNGVKAGLAETPEGYRFCGLAEALRGSPGRRERARRGYRLLWPGTDTPGAAARCFANYTALVAGEARRLRYSGAGSGLSDPPPG